MAWCDIAMIVFVCTTANHLGLIEAIERTIWHKLPVIDCVKCFSFWSTMIYCVAAGYEMIPSIAVSFLAAYTAVWLELGLGFIDTIYNKGYGWIYDETSVTKTDGNETGADTKDASYSKSTVPEVRLNEKNFE